jgi:hypothetical protein
MAEYDGFFTWNVKQIADALKIKEADVRLYFTDGRRVSFLLERRLAYEVLHGKLAPSEGAGYDLIDSHGGKWEVRSITRDGIYFCPSYMVGSGRSFNKKGFLEKIREIKGYIISDIESFPDVPFWVVPSRQVIAWWKDGELGTTTKISREKALKLVKSIA